MTYGSVALSEAVKQARNTRTSANTVPHVLLCCMFGLGVLSAGTKNAFNAEHRKEVSRQAARQPPEWLLGLVLC